MVEVCSDVGGERHCVADEKKRSSIVADARMAWMWKVGDGFVSNNIKVKKKKKKQKRRKTSKQSVIVLFFGLVHILVDAKQQEWL